MIRVHGFSLYGQQAASTRYRLTQYIPGLRDLGIDLRVSPLLTDAYLRSRFAGRSTLSPGLAWSALTRLRELATLHRADAAVLYAELLPLCPGRVERALLSRPYVYDMDDAFYLRYRTGRLARLAPLLGGKCDRVVAGAAAVTAGSPVLRDYASRFNARTTLLPTVVDVTRYVPDPSHRTGPFTVGWVGSPSTAAYLGEVVAPLAQLGAEGTVRLVVMGGAAPTVPGVEVVELPWSEAAEVPLINSFDVGIMPLTDDPWARGKCAFKLIQYMACAVPVVASPVGANAVVVTPACGLLARTPAEWLEALRWMRDHPGERRQMGEAGRQRIEEAYSLQVAVPRFAEVIRGVVGKG
jgi:glycosyltransferase involved in cell wall biosynthesis